MPGRNGSESVAGITRNQWPEYVGIRIYSKYMDPSGDFLVVEVSQVGMERDWKYLYGTGKWKGVTGGGKAFPFTKGKPITAGTMQSCIKITGTYEIKK